MTRLRHLKEDMEEAKQKINYRYAEVPVEDLELLLKIVGIARQVNNHWNEFGPEYGLDRHMDYLYDALRELYEEDEREATF